MDGITHKIGDCKHPFRQKDLGGSNLLSRKCYKSEKQPNQRLESPLNLMQTKYHN